MTNRPVGSIAARLGPLATKRTARIAVVVAALAAALSATTGAQSSLPVSAPFDMIGFIQSATIDRPVDLFSGGTITVNNIRMIVPRNTLLQFPATALTWQEAFALAPAPYTTLQTGLACVANSFFSSATVWGKRAGSRMIRCEFSKSSRLFHQISITQS